MIPPFAIRLRKTRDVSAVRIGKCTQHLMITYNGKISKNNIYKGFSHGSMVKNPPAKQETRVGSLGQEDPLEKEMATLSSILAWVIPWSEEPGGP